MACPVLSDSMKKKKYLSEQDIEINNVFLNKNFVSNHSKQPCQQAACDFKKI